VRAAAFLAYVEFALAVTGIASAVFSLLPRQTVGALGSGVGRRRGRRTLLHCGVSA